MANQISQPDVPFDLLIGNNPLISVDLAGDTTISYLPGQALVISATTLTGNLTGNVQGDVDGSALGVTPIREAITGDGAITIPNDGTSVVFLSKGSAAAITIAAPTTPAQDGTMIFVKSISAFAHVVTCASDGFNAKGSSGTATCATPFTGLLLLYADGGHWYTLGQNLWTIA